MKTTVDKNPEHRLMQMVERVLRSKGATKFGRALAEGKGVVSREHEAVSNDDIFTVVVRLEVLIGLASVGDESFHARLVAAEQRFRRGLAEAIVRDAAIEVADETGHMPDVAAVVERVEVLYRVPDPRRFHGQFTSAFVRSFREPKFYTP